MEQTPTTTLSEVEDITKTEIDDKNKSIVIGDTNVQYNTHSVYIEPIIVNFSGDIAYSFQWTIFGLRRNSIDGCNAYITLHGKNNEKLAEYNQTIPADIVNVWTDDSIIDEYIISQNKRFKKI